MSEPISGSAAEMAAGAAAFKAIGGPAAVAAIAALVVMMTPRSPREWAVGLISTVVSSVAGGAAVAQKFGLQAWTHDYIGLVALFGVVFACGAGRWCASCSTSSSAGATSIWPRWQETCATR
ncbi:hypothetical protein ACU4HD_15145 [Cupriavidus basilensis]